MTFYVGQKVVYIGGHKPSPYLITIRPADRQKPTRGNIYTVRQINQWPHATLILLHELDNSHLIGRPGIRGHIEPGFNSAGFRPIVERKTDISIFTAMLTPKSVPAKRTTVSQP